MMGDCLRSRGTDTDRRPAYKEHAQHVYYVMGVWYGSSVKFIRHASLGWQVAPVVLGRGRRGRDA